MQREYYYSSLGCRYSKHGPVAYGDGSLLRVELSRGLSLHI